MTLEEIHERIHTLKLRIDQDTLELFQLMNQARQLEYKNKIDGITDDILKNQRVTKQPEVPDNKQVTEIPEPPEVS